MLNNKTVLCFGDSWTGGHDMNPDSTEDDYFHPEHVEYRQRETWPSFIDAKEVINLGSPGASNDQILREVIEYITLNDIDDVFVIVGWTTLCRKEVIFTDENDNSRRSTLWPSTGGIDFYPKPIYELHKLHVQYFWSEEEMFNRYLHHNITLSSFLKTKDIPFLAYNSFYEFPRDGDKSVSKISAMFRKFKESIFDDEKGSINNDHMLSEHLSLDRLGKTFPSDKLMWDKIIDEKQYYHKNDFSKSFQSFIGHRMKDDNYFFDYHPTKLSHEMWAEEITKYINDKWS